MKKIILITASLIIAMTLILPTTQVEAAKKIPSSIFTKGILFLVKKVDSSFYNVPATTEAGEDYVQITPGTIAFNNGTNGGVAQINFTVLSTGHHVITYANAPLSGFITLQKVNISVSKGASLLADKTVQATQWFSYRPSSTGDFNVRYTTTEKHKWTPYMTYRWDNGGLNPGQGKSIEDPELVQIPSKTIDEETVLTNMITTKEGNFFKPSKGHVNKFKTKRQLTLKELNLQFYDEVLKTSVYKMKDFVNGDNVIMNDTVNSVEFNEDNNTSNIYFLSNEEPLQFKGDLTNKYQNGDNLTLSFTVVPLDDQYELNTINYIKDFYETDQVPDINEYIE